jgi:hypothetical protein
MWGFFSISVAFIFLAIGYLLRRFAGPTVPYVVQIATAYAWLVSFSVIALVPIDVWSTLAQAPQGGISILWRIAYWSTQVRNWSRSITKF